MLELSQITLQRIAMDQYFPTPSEVKAIAKQLHELRNPEIIRVMNVPNGVTYVASRA